MDDHLLWQILLQLFLILLNAVFACAEIAVLSVNSNKLEKMAEEGNRKALRLRKLIREPARFLATIQVAITLSGFLGSAFAADNFAGLFVHWLVSLNVGIAPGTLNTIAVIVITLLLSYLTLIFGELVPKRLAMRKADKMALGLTGTIGFISKVFAPIVWLLTISTNLILRLLGIDPEAADKQVTEEEIRLMVDEGSAKGIIDSEEHSIIQNVFEFDDLTVGEIATHRTEMTFLWLEESVEEWDQVIRKSEYTYYPICDESVDNVIGILNSKAYLRLNRPVRETVMEQAVKPVYFVPESMKADSLFRNMKKNRNYFAVVLDEYGGTHGIVTLSDLLVQIVGELEEDEEEKEIVEQPEGVYLIQCSADIDRLKETFGIELETESSTVGGWVMEQVGDIPEPGEHFEVQNLDVTVTATDGRRVLEIRVQRKNEEAATGPAE